MLPTEELKLQIDRPYIGDGSSDITVRGGLMIDGWALARAGVAAIEVSIGDLLIPAAYGLLRPDVGNAYQDWTNSQQSGFTALIPRHKLAVGRHRVQVTLRDRNGQALASEFPLVVAAPVLRSKIGLAERDLQHQLLESLDWWPDFYLILLVDGDAHAVARTQATLRSIRGQAYCRWQVLVVPHRRAADLDTMRRRLRDGLDNIESLRAARLRRYGEDVISADNMLDGFSDIYDKINLLDCDEEKIIAELGSGSPGPKLFSVLTAGDELSCDALLEMAIASGTHLDAELLYSDELRFDFATQSLEAFLKPQWSPDLLLSTNYIGRFWCARPQLLARTRATLGDLTRLGDYDLVLRMTEATVGIHHVSKVLCRRASDPHGAVSIGRRALERAIARRGIAGEIRPGCLAGTYRLQRRQGKPGLVSIIIPTRASRGLVKTCIDTLRSRTAHRALEIIVIENIPPSEAGWKKWLRANADRVIATEEPFNWSRFMNLAAAGASGEFLLFLNDDVEIIEPDWLDALLEHGQRPEVGVVGALLLYPDRSIQHAGIFLTDRPRSGGAKHPFRYAPQTSPGYFGLALTQRNVIAVTGACMLTRRDTFERLGGFNEAHPIVNNDVDYCLRAWRAGLLTIFTPYSRLIHHERGSRNEFGEDYNRDEFANEWRDIFADGDPFHHPQLSKEFDDFIPEAEPTRLICAGSPLMQREAIQNILIIKLDHIGDCITAFPAVRRLKQSFPHASLRVLASPWTAAVWPLAGIVDEVIEFEFFHMRQELGAKEVPESDFVALRRRLEPYRFDLAVDLRRPADTRHLLQYASARFLAGFELDGRFPWLDIAVEWGGDLVREPKRNSVSDDLIVLVDAIRASSEQDRLVIQQPLVGSLPLSQKLQAGLFSRPLVCVHASAGAAFKQWPIEYFVELIDLLIEREQVNVAITGGRDDKQIAERISKSVRHRGSLFDLSGELGLADLANFMQRCVLFVGNDSGPKHIAAGIGVPTLGVHSGHVDAREWGPVGPYAVALRREMACGPCYITDVASCPRDLACLTGLRPGEVYEACRRLLAIGLRRQQQPRPQPRPQIATA